MPEPANQTNIMQNQRLNLAHDWAHNRRPRRVGNVRFDENGLFYSFSTPIASRLKQPLSPPGASPVFLLSDSRWSNSTAPHQSACRMAIFGDCVFRSESREVRSPQAFAQDTLRLAVEFQAQAKVTQEKFPRRKSVIHDLQSKALAHFETAKRLAELFSLPIDLPDSATLESLAAEKLLRDAEQEQARKEREAQEQAKRVDALARWRNHEEGITARYLPQDGKTYFRVAIGTPVPSLQSSKGVFIGGHEAIRAIRFIESKRESGWRKNGERYPIADFELDTITHEGIVAGCHRFTWQELETVKAEIVKAGFSLA